MLNPSAVLTKSGQRYPVDSDIEVVMREKALYKVGLGWTYRFRSGESWVLILLDQVQGFEFEEKPEGSADRSPKGRPEGRSLSSVVPHAAKYVDELV